MSESVKTKKIIGRFETVSFPELKLLDIEAKVDTGAYTSSIHCHDIHEDLEKKKIYFKLLDPSHPDYNETEIAFENYTKTRVKSSTGIAQSRYKIKTYIQMGEKSYKTTFTLADRGSMRYPVLLGRIVLRNRFIVDVSKEHVLSPKK
jgi:hypothetical protein